MYSSEILGRRILEERDRLGLSQQEAARQVGVRREMWAKYEAGSEPGAKVLAGMAAIGADVQYILTGQRQGNGIGESAVHQAVLDAVDLLSLEKKVNANQLARAVVKLAAKSGVPKPISGAKIVVHGSIGQAMDAPISGGNFTVHMGGSEPGKKK